MFDFITGKTTKIKILDCLVNAPCKDFKALCAAVSFKYGGISADTVRSTLDALELEGLVILCLPQGSPAIIVQPRARFALVDALDHARFKWQAALCGYASGFVSGVALTILGACLR